MPRGPCPRPAPPLRAGPRCRPQDPLGCFQPPGESVGPCGPDRRPLPSPAVAMARGRPASRVWVERTPGCCVWAQDPSAIWASCVYRSSLPARLQTRPPGLLCLHAERAPAGARDGGWNVGGERGRPPEDVGQRERGTWGGYQRKGKDRVEAERKQGRALEERRHRAERQEAGGGGVAWGCSWSQMFPGPPGLCPRPSSPGAFPGARCEIPQCPAGHR